MSALLALCIVPVVALLGIGAYLGRDCVTLATFEGKASTTLAWRIEQERCGDGPLVTNVLVAPAGKTMALAASSTGTPAPVGVARYDDGTTTLLLAAAASDGATARVLPLKTTGRPAQPLVLRDGLAKR